MHHQKAGSRKRRLRWAGVMLLALSAVANSQPADKLSYQWLPGQVTDYTVYVIGEIQTAGEAAQSIKLYYLDSWEVLEENQVKRTYRMEEKSLDFSGTALDLSSFGILAKNTKLERTVDDYGRVIAINLYPKAHRYYLLPLTFSTKPVAPKAKWKISQDLLLPLFNRQVTAKANVLYTFEDVAKHYKGRPQECARFRVDAEYLYQTNNQKAGVSGNFSGKIFFDLAQRIVVDYQITEERKEWDTAVNQKRTTTLQVTSILTP